MRYRIVTPLGVAAAAVATLALAQTMQTSGIEDLVDQALARASDLKKTLTGVDADGALAKAKAYQADAASLSAGNRERLRQGMSYLSADYRIDPYGDDAAGNRDEGVVYIAVSLSMPQASLRELARDANRAGATLVIRGLVDNSFAKTRSALKAVFVEGEEAGLVIDPRVFQQFHIDRVPAVIVAQEPVQPCENGLECERPEVPFDVVRGNISLEQSLKLLASRGEASPGVARQALERLED